MTDRIKDLSVEVKLRNNQLLERRRRLGLSQKKLVAAAGVEFNNYTGLETLRVSPVRSTLPPQVCIHGACERGTHASSFYCKKHRAYEGLFDDNAARARRKEKRRCGPHEWRKAALQLAAFYDMEPGELFPEALLRIEKTTIERFIDADELQRLMAVEAEEPKFLMQDEAVEAMQAGAAVRRAVAMLPGRQQKVLELRFGLESRDSDKTMKDVAEAIGVSSGRAQQIVQRALRNLRHPSRSRVALGYTSGKQVSKCERSGNTREPCWGVINRTSNGLFACTGHYRAVNEGLCGGYEPRISLKGVDP